MNWYNVGLIVFGIVMIAAGIWGYRERESVAKFYREQFCQRSSKSRPVALGGF